MPRRRGRAGTGLCLALVLALTGACAGRTGDLPEVSIGSSGGRSGDSLDAAAPSQPVGGSAEATPAEGTAGTPGKPGGVSPIGAGGTAVTTARGQATATTTTTTGSGPGARVPTNPAPGSGVPGSPATGPSLPGDRTGVTDTQLALGWLYPRSGPYQTIFRNIERAVETARNEANDAGGINGRKLAVKYWDDGFTDASVATTNYRAARNEVFGVSTIVTAGITLSPMIERDKVPHLQAIGSVDVVKPLRYSFPIRTMPETETTLLAAFIKNYMKLGTKKIGVVYQADFTTPVTNFRRAAQAAGLNIVVEQSVPPIPNTCVNEMLNVANKGAEVVVLIAGPLPAICVLRDSKSVNFQPTWTGPAGWNFNITNTATGGATEGALTFGGWRTLETPEGQHYIEQRRKYFGADGDAESDDLAIVAYWEARLWIEALRRAGREVTRESFVDTMEAMSGYDTGFLPPGEWSPGDHTGARSVCIFKAVNGKWVTSDRQWHRSF